MRSSRKTNRLLIPLLLTALCAAVWFSARTGRECSPPVPAPVEQSREDIPSAPAPAESNAPPEWRSVVRDWSPTGLPGFEQESLRKKGRLKIDPQKLRKYEGSYTAEEIRSGSGGSESLPLNSQWLYKGSNRPQVQMKIGKNPVTGLYEPVGGEVALPLGVGMSYEEDAQTGEQKTFLKLKKDF